MSKLFPRFKEKMCHIICLDQHVFLLNLWILTVLCYSLVLLKMCFFPKLRDHSKDIILTISEISGFTFLCWKVLWPDPVQSTRLRNQYWKAQTLGRTLKQVIACQALYGTTQHQPRSKIKGCTYLWITILKWSYYKISINSSGCEHGWYFCYLEVNRKPLYLLLLSWRF